MSYILVADDMAVLREPIAAALRSKGYEVQCASDGLETLKAISLRMPDLMLLDISMPNLDGLGVLRALRDNSTLSSISIIMLTAVQERDYIVNAIKLGVKDFMLKSQFSLDELFHRIQSHLAQKLKISVTDSPISTTPKTAGKHPPVKTSTPAPDIATPVHVAKTESHNPSDKFSTESNDLSASSLQRLRDLKPIIVRSKITELLDNCGELKAMSPIVAQILSLTLNPRCSIEQIASVIKQDHAVALKILAMANSVIYTRGEPVESVNKAVMRIGISQIRQAVLNISVIQQFDEAAFGQALRSSHFWEHSIATGLIAAELSRALNNKAPEIESAFTMGLIHDVGRLVYAENLGDQYIQTLTMAAELQLPLEMVESRLLLVNHADAMDRVLHAWHFPKHLINPIAFHHLSMGNIRRMSTGTIDETATLALANRLAHAMLLGGSGNQTIYPTEEFCQSLKIGPKSIASIEAEIPGQTDDIKLAMLSKSKDAGWIPVSNEMRSMIGPPIHPIYISANPDLDAYRMLFDRLADQKPDEPPNLGVIHFTDVRERVALTTRFKTAEATANVAALPLLIFSPMGNIQLEERAMANRQYELLTTPTAHSSLIASIKRLLNATT